MTTSPSTPTRAAGARPSRLVDARSSGEKRDCADTISSSPAPTQNSLLFR
jgi:hypothetical protein